MTPIEYAKYAGKTPQHVYKLIRQGKLEKGEDGKVDRVACDAVLGWKGCTPGYEGSGRPKVLKTADESPEQLPGGTDPTVKRSFAEARRDREDYLARTAKLEYEEQRGNLVPRALVEKLLMESNRRVREGMLNIPDRLAAQLAAETDQRLVRQMLDVEIRNALESLADDLGK